MDVVLGQEITIVPREVWDRSQPTGKADWQNLAWQQMTALNGMPSGRDMWASSV